MGHNIFETDLKRKARVSNAQRAAGIKNLAKAREKQAQQRGDTPKNLSKEELCYKGFTPKIKMDGSSMIIKGYVKGYPSIEEFSGKDVEEFHRNFVKSVDAYWKKAQQEGLDPRYYTGKITAVVGPQYHARVTRLADKYNSSVSEVVTKALMYFFDEVIHRGE